MARPVGSTNKNKDRLWKALKAEYGDDFDPLLTIAKNANVLQDAVNLSLEHYEDASEDEKKEAVLLAFKLIPEVNKEWYRVAEFITPKLKAVEVSGSDDSPLRVMTLDYKDA